jgi:DASS family divalent anion:Na+ symporter
MKLNAADLTVAVAVGAPPLLAALVLAFFSSPCVSLTHYGGDPSPVYYSANYATLRRWWGIRFVVAALNVLIFLGVGPFYWKMLGLFERKNYEITSQRNLSRGQGRSR